MSLLLLAAQATGGAHMLLVPHVRNLVTGQLGHPGHSLRCAPRTPAAPSAWGVVPGEADESDADCLIALHHQSSSLEARPAELVPADVAPGPEPVWSSVPRAVRCIHRLAPKHGPPA